MLNRTEVERLAAMAHELRPDWPIASLCTFLNRDHAHRAYRDVAVALVWVATDPKTLTPARMNELGPWWQALASAAGVTSIDTVPGRTEARCDEHPWARATPCPACAAEAKQAPHVDAPDDAPLPPRRGAPIPPEARAVLDALPRPTREALR